MFFLRNLQLSCGKLNSQTEVQVKNERIPHIDAWRCIAVVLVVISHIFQHSSDWYRDHLPWMFIGRMPTLGRLGVDIFFCISGFVICRGLIAEKAYTGTISLRAFYVRRLLRIVPPLAMYMLALALLSSLGYIDVRLPQFAHAGAFICNLDLRECGWFLAHTWSLAYEEQFYLIFPLVFAASAVLGGARLIVAFTLALMATSLLASALDQLTVATFSSTFVYMLVGCSAAMYWDDIRPQLARINPASWSVAVVATSVCSIFIPWPASLSPIVTSIVLPLAICVCVLSTPVKAPWVGRIFLDKRVIHVGRISFTLYLWQQLACTKGLFPHPAITFVALVGAAIIAALSFEFLEQPLARLGRRYTESTRRSLPVTAPEHGRL